MDKVVAEVVAYPPADNATQSPSPSSRLGDWELRVDLVKQLRFPEHIAPTTHRHGHLLQLQIKKVIMAELTVPWEERIDEAQERKRAKYQELTGQCRSNGWTTLCEPFEVGCRGFAGHSLCRLVAMLGIVGLAKKRAIKSNCRCCRESH